MGEWVKAAEVQLEMYRWITSPSGWMYMRNWIASEKMSDPEKGHMYDMLSWAERQKLLTADAIWVSPDMCEIVMAAREGFQPETIEREDFITHTGFVYFAEPLLMLDRNKRTVSIGAMSWCPAYFTTENAEQVKSRMQEEEGTEVTITDAPEKSEGVSICLYSSTTCEEDDYSDTHDNFRRLFGIDLVPLHFTIVEFGNPLDDGDLYDVRGHYTGADQWWKTVQTTLRLMQQRVFVREEAQLPRPTRRRWKRETKHDPSEVLIIRLRRADTKREQPEEESGRKLTHRHLRDGHWRGQWYPSVQRHRQIWISPTIVGDENLPLVIKRRFYKWDR